MMDIDEGAAPEGQEGRTDAATSKKAKDPITDGSFFHSLLTSDGTFSSLLQDFKAVPAPTALRGGGGGCTDVDSNNESDVTAAASASDAVARSDQLEIVLRSHVVLMLSRVLGEQKPPPRQEGEDEDGGGGGRGGMPAAGRHPDEVAMPCLSSLGDFWTRAIQLCQHWIHFSGHYQRYLHIASIRRLAFVLLEDILDSLPLRDAKAFWTGWFVPSQPRLAKIDAEGAPTSSSSNLVLLKTLNGFLKRCSTAARDDSDPDSDGQWPARVLQTLASSFPLGERSATRVWGSRNLESLSEFETSDQYHKHTASAASASEMVVAQAYAQSDITPSSAAAVSSLTIDYSVYDSLWSLQQDFASPFVKNVGVFLSRIRTVLQVMETTTPAPQVAADGNSASTGKYLTHARLLPYQLQDPDFRAHVLAQLLIVAHHVSNEAPGVGAQLEEIRERAARLVEAARPDLLSALNRALEASEPQWCGWKKSKFPDIDVKPPRASSTPPRKRRRAAKESGSSKAGLSIGASTIPALVDLHNDLPSICAPLQAPSLEKHLEAHEYIDALDPNAGIEDEYHPKSNPYFCWQALRLLPIADLDKVHYGTGDFEAAVRHIWMREKRIRIPTSADPGAAAAAEEVSVKDDQEGVSGLEGMESDKSNAQESVTGDEDVSMREADDTMKGVNNDPQAGETHPTKLESPPEPEREDSAKDESLENGVKGTYGTFEANAPSNDGEKPTTAALDVQEKCRATSLDEQEAGEHLTKEPTSAERIYGEVPPESRQGSTTTGEPTRPAPLPADGRETKVTKTNATPSERGAANSKLQATRHSAGQGTTNRTPRDRSPPRRENSYTRTNDGRDGRGGDAVREDAYPRASRSGGDAEFARHPSGSSSHNETGPRRVGREVAIEVDSRGGGRRGVGPHHGLKRDDWNNAPAVRDGNRGPSDDRAPAFQPSTRDERGPTLPRRDERGPPHASRKDDRGSQMGKDDRGRHPVKDERGPPPRPREDRGPPQSLSGRRDDRGHPPPVAGAAGRDDRGATLGRREDRWTRGDRQQDRRQDASGGEGAGLGNRGVGPRDSRRPRR